MSATTLLTILKKKSSSKLVYLEITAPASMYRSKRALRVKKFAAIYMVKTSCEKN